MKNLHKLVMLLAFLVAVAAMSGCVMFSKTPIFKSSAKVDMPDISGAFSTMRDKKKETYVLNRVNGTTNTFTVTSPDKSVMTLIFEPLKVSGRYVVQVQNPAGADVVLGLCEIKDQQIAVRAIKQPEIVNLAKKHGVTIDETNGVITKKPSDSKLKEFFNACFDQKYSEVISTIKPGSPPKSSGSGKSKGSK